jgi:ssDNA-binding Zn-finger/Zn-ribbon topoisomerase 1
MIKFNLKYSGGFMSEAIEPVCPKCGEKMVLREGYKGKFYGCTNFRDVRVQLIMPANRKNVRHAAPIWY